MGLKVPTIGDCILDYGAVCRMVRSELTRCGLLGRSPNDCQRLVDQHYAAVWWMRALWWAAIVTAVAVVAG